MAGHRRTSSRHRDSRSWPTLVARAGRVGMLLAAVLTTVTVAVAAIDPYRDASAGTRSYDRDSSTMPSLLDGLATLQAKVRAARATPDGSDTRRPSGAQLPGRSGTGRRVVFDISEQRVWIVRGDERVRSTYLVSGSRSDNLKPGRYRVFSRSRWAVGFDRHSTMQYFVRFARGKHSNIGFHDIPVDHAGNRVQSYDALGTPRSAGCIRQQRSDAKRMWRFAKLDTAVVVVA